LKYFGDWGLGIGDWGLGIGDWPNPQSPIPDKDIKNEKSLSHFEKNISNYHRIRHNK